MATREEIIKMYTEPKRLYGEQRTITIRGAEHMVGGVGSERGCYVAKFGCYGMKGDTICSGTPSEVADWLIAKYGCSSLKVIYGIDPMLTNGL